MKNKPQSNVVIGMVSLVFIISATAQAEASRLCEEQIMAAMFVGRYEDVCSGSLNISSAIGNVAGQACKVNGESTANIKKLLSTYTEKFKNIPAQQFCNKGSTFYKEMAMLILQSK